MTVDRARSSACEENNTVSKAILAVLAIVCASVLYFALTQRSFGSQPIKSSGWRCTLSRLYGPSRSIRGSAACMTPGSF